MIALNSATLAAAVFLILSILETQAATIEDGFTDWMGDPGKPIVAISENRHPETDNHLSTSENGSGSRTFLASLSGNTTTGETKAILPVSRSGMPETVAFRQHVPFSRPVSVTDQLLVTNVDIWNVDNALQYLDFTFTTPASTWSSVAVPDAPDTASFMFRTTGELFTMPVTSGFLARPAIFAPLAKMSLPAGAPLIVSGLAALFCLRRLRRKAT